MLLSWIHYLGMNGVRVAWIYHLVIEWKVRPSWSFLLHEAKYVYKSISVIVEVFNMPI